MTSSPVFPILIFSSLFLLGCGSREEAQQAAEAAPSPVELATGTPEIHGVEVKDVQLTNPLKAEWVAAGKAIYDMKCLACHKLTGEKLVGPGWLDVTKRRQPV